MDRLTAAELQQRAQGALSSSSIFALRDLNVETQGELLFLSGRVESFYHKQLAQELVRSVCDGLQVVNEIDVQAQELG